MGSFKTIHLVTVAALIMAALIVPKAALAAQVTYFKAAHSGLCLDVENGSQSNGVKVQQWGCNNTGAQQWEIVYVGSGDKFNGQAGNYYALININSDKCLEVRDWSTYNGAQVTQWDCHYGANQQWLLYNHWTITGYKVSLVNKHSRKCADVPSWSKSQGTGIVQWDCNLKGNQQWWWNGQ